MIPSARIIGQDSHEEEIPQGFKLVEIKNDFDEATLKFLYYVKEDVVALSGMFRRDYGDLDFECVLPICSYLLLGFYPVGEIIGGVAVVRRNKTVEFDDWGKVKGPREFEVVSTEVVDYEITLTTKVADVLYLHQVFQRAEPEHDWIERELSGYDGKVIIACKRS